MLAPVLLLPIGLAGFIGIRRSRKSSAGHLTRDAVSGLMAGPYELLDRIGEGGMGCVYRARHTLLRRASAVKLLRQDRLTMMDVGRFEREVKLAAQLTSPHTIQIYDFGKTDDGSIYYAMEYLQGLTLSSVVNRSGSLPAARVLHFLIQLCKSAEEAHRAGLIHRDIKPQNIMITRRGTEPDWLILFDFGLAKSVAPSQGEFRTREMVWSGTPIFMSPERIRSPAAVDPRMDIYAIGAVGYYMLCGHEPFTASTPEMVFEQVLNFVPSPPSQSGATNSIARLDALVMRCLAKSADDRPECISQLRKQLESLATVHRWSLEEAEHWWTKYARELNQ